MCGLIAVLVVPAYGDHYGVSEEDWVKYDFTVNIDAGEGASENVIQTQLERARLPGTDLPIAGVEGLRFEITDVFEGFGIIGNLFITRDGEEKIYRCLPCTMWKNLNRKNHYKIMRIDDFVTSTLS